MRCLVGWGVVAVLCACANSQGQNGDKEQSGTPTSGSDGSGETAADTNDATESGGEPQQCESFEPGACGEGNKCGTTWAAHGAPLEYVCVPVLGDGPTGEVCTFLDGDGSLGHDDCAEGSICYPTDLESWTGYCAELCDGDLWSCASGGFCEVNETWRLCSWPCDPVRGGLCPGPDLTCALVTESVLCWVIEETGQQLDPCTTEHDCGFELTCAVGAEVEGCSQQRCCTEFCDLAQADPCGNPAHTCQPAFSPGNEQPGLEHLGVCKLP